MNEYMKVCPMNEIEMGELGFFKGEEEEGRKEKRKKISLHLQCPWKSDAPRPIP